jgi:hypothetical protein
LLGAAIACVTIEDDPAPRRPTGGTGESCFTRADCSSGLGCIANVCTDLDAAADAEVAPDGGAAGDGEGGSTDSAVAAEPAKIGDACTDSAGCAAGLACVRGVCSGSENGLVPTGKECVVIACRAPADCCPKPSSSCSYYEQQCTAGVTSYCTLFDSQCVCKESDWSCVNDQCKYAPACGPNDTCAQARVCVDSLCVECATDADCAAGRHCVANACVIACTRDEQCALFHRCEASSCVWVGCSTDRECITLTNDPLAACLDGNCRASCVSDGDCNPDGFDGSVCYEGYCQPMGCETDDECRISLSGQLTGNKEAECRAP